MAVPARCTGIQHPDHRGPGVVRQVCVRSGGGHSAELREALGRSDSGCFYQCRPSTRDVSAKCVCCWCALEAVLPPLSAHSCAVLLPSS